MSANGKVNSEGEGISDGIIVVGIFLAAVLLFGVLAGVFWEVIFFFFDSVFLAGMFLDGGVFLE